MKNSKPLEVLITSGGTISKIDDVRHIGNFSSGTTGALIAEEFLKHGAIVHYVHNKYSKRPLRENLILDPNKNINDEIEKIKKARQEYTIYSPSLIEYAIETFDEYYETLKTILKTKPIDAVVLAAAVSDYSAIYSQGKISSDKEDLSIKMKKNPKVISLIKTWKPDVFQVGFKLLADVDSDELINTAYNHGIKNNSNLTVANSINNSNFKDRTTYFLTPEKEIINTSLDKIALDLVNLIYQRI